MAFVRSPLKTGSAPTPPAEPMVPNFVVELSSAITSNPHVFTVTNPGLYFLSTGCTAYTKRTTGISITSAHLPYVYNQTPASGTNAGAFSYMVVDLDASDTVSFSNNSGHGYAVALRFTNGSFDSVIDTVYDENDAITITPDSDYPCFIFGGVSNERTTIYDNSTTSDPESVTENAIVASNTVLWRAIGCYGANSATLNISGLEFSAVGGVCIKMANVSPRPAGYNVPSIELVYNSALTIASEEYTITADGLYFIAVGFTHKGSGTLILPQDVTPIRQQDLIYTTSGIQRGVKYALTRLSTGDVITIGSTADSWRGHYRYIIKLDDNLTITPTPVTESIIADALITYPIIDDDYHLIFSMDTSMNGYDSENYQKLESSVEEVGLWFTSGDGRGKCHVAIISNAENKATYYSYGYNGGFSALIDFDCSYS